jgi:hypothetical protein
MRCWARSTAVMTSSDLVYEEGFISTVIKSSAPSVGVWSGRGRLLLSTITCERLHGPGMITLMGRRRERRVMQAAHTNGFLMKV